MRVVAVIGALILGAVASIASAQEATRFASVLATGAEGFGQGIGDSMLGGPSVFVTGTGAADLPAPLVDALFVTVEGKSSSAVEASRLRDERLASARAIAQRFNVEVQVGSSSFAREVDMEAQMRRNRAEAAQAAQAAKTPPPLFIPPYNNVSDAADRVFAARTSVRFRATESRQLPLFLDALKAAGIDELFNGLGNRPPTLFSGMSEVLGFGSLQKIDDAVWDRASQAAMAACRRQATVLATAAGRQLGEARQILFLTRSVQGSEASVTLAVRFGFAPAK